MIEPLSDAETQLVRHQWQRLRRDIEAIEIAAPIAGDIQNILKSRGRNERDLRQPPFDDRVGHPRGAMDETLDLALLQPYGLNGFEHRLHRRVRTRRNLGNAGFSGIMPDGTDIRERASDVRSDFPA